jgi:SPOR domain
MFSRRVDIGAPVLGFALGLVVTYGLADAGPGPVPAGLLQDQLVSRISIGSEIRVGDGRFISFKERFVGDISFNERFVGDRDTKKSLAEGRYRLASLGAPVGSNVLVDAGSVFAPSADAHILFSKPSDSFAERFSGTKILVNAASVVRPPESSWVVQLIGDDTEVVALSRFRQLQNKHKAILGIYNPLVVNTTLTPGAPPIWTRVRVGLNSREAAQSLCAQLESAGERCVVQRNTSALSNT